MALYRDASGYMDIWWPELIFPNGDLEWSTIDSDDHYLMSIDDYNMPDDAAGDLPWATGLIFEFKAHLTLPTYNYSSWMNGGGILGLISFSDGTSSDFEEVGAPFIIPTGITGETHSYAYLIGSATSDYYSDNPDVTKIDKNDYKIFYVDLKSVFKSGGTSLTKIKIITECDPVFDSITQPMGGWNTFTWSDETLANK